MDRCVVVGDDSSVCGSGEGQQKLGHGVGSGEEQAQRFFKYFGRIEARN